MKYTYLLVNFLSVVVPFLFSFHPRIRFYKHFKPYFIANVISAICFIGWDIYFTRQGIWGFNEQYTLGIKLINLPLEEVLFFFCIPFSCIFTFHCFGLYFKKQWNPATENIFVILFSFFLLLIGLLYLNRAYPSVTFISTAILLLVFKFVFKINWLYKLFTVFLFLLLPFFIVNGILTGSGLEQPVVWYNNAETLGIRMLTIPLEDTIYGFELILLTLFVYENLNSVRISHKDAKNTK